MFDLHFDTCNAAFADDGAGGRREAARILRDIAAKLESGADDGAARDGNGNSCGRWRFEPEGGDE